jgi:hypothetical protein
VGYYYYGAGGPERSLIERWNGEAWQVQSSPDLGRLNLLTGVSCSSRTDCVAVGSHALAWNGRRWTIERRSSPGDSVSCPSRAFCVAIGVRQGRPFAGYRRRGNWTTGAMPSPLPATRLRQIDLSRVSCVSASFCLAVGDYLTGPVTAMPSPNSRRRVLAEAWNGAAWRILRPVDTSRLDNLIGVSCSSPAACTAVGSASGGRLTLAERWDGKSWSIQRTPNLNPVGYNVLAGVSCTSAAACTAVGNLDGGEPLFAEYWDGHSWTLQRMAGLGGRQRAVADLSVACTSPSVCVAVGEDGTSTLAEAWDGRTWRIRPTPNPA